MKANPLFATSGITLMFTLNLFEAVLIDELVLFLEIPSTKNEVVPPVVSSPTNSIDFIEKLWN